VINIAEIINDPDFAQEYTIKRDSGQFGPGGWQPNITTIPAYGPVTVADANTLDMIPEGDRPKGAMSFYSTTEIYETHTNNPKYGQGGAGQGGYGGSQGTSDQIWWRNQKYRVSKVFPWADYGYWHAVGVRMSGE
jgi:hypothetical protein